MATVGQPEDLDPVIDDCVISLVQWRHQRAHARPAHRRHLTQGKRQLRAVPRRWRNVADALSQRAPAPGSQPRQITSIEPDGAGSDSDEAGADVQQGRLARPVLADDANEGPGGNIETLNVQDRPSRTPNPNAVETDRPAAHGAASIR